MVASGHSVRLRVDLHSKTPIIFSYPDLLKRHEKTLKEAPKASMLLDDEQDPFYKALLDRAAKYDMNPGGEDVDSGEEDNQQNKDTKGDEYDYEDPFIDDSEMMLDESYEYSQPEFDGFFVYHGALDGSDNVSGTKKKSNAKKEKSTASTGKAKASTYHKGGPTMKKSTSATTTTSADTTKKASVKTNKGTAPTSASASKSAANTNSATNTTSSTTAKSAPSSSSSTTSTGDSNKKPGKVSSSKLQPLHPTLEPLMEKIRVDRAKETFEIKSKFPSNLRPTVLEMATKMFRLYHKMDENVINHLMAILPYNRFTMKKFLTTKSGPGVVTEFQKEIDRLIEHLQKSVDEAMPEHLQQYEQKLMEQQNQAVSDGPDVEKKFRCNETIRRTLYDILTLDMHSVNLSNEIAEFNGRNDMVESETKARKLMYTKLLPCWPSGWMTTYDISRQYSTYKAKMKNTDETSVKLGLSSPSASTSTGSATTMSSSGAKRSTTTPVKRSAPSSNSANGYNGAQGSGGTEKRKKVAVNQGPTDSESNRQASQESNTHDTKVEPDDVKLKESPSIAELTTPHSSPSSHKPSSMNIASLISGP
ncbi:hypothetical protein BCR42DRAFT_416468 [Absidia repens]|uniref:Ubinuclein middle domain-containing protein n=1 Tax=Absidia repens TaxID=90262 RepID=A0A1X2IEJ2_9FUNG|nr:hypothetical protein BCR42DRAFT_416468 [Absidia repens]